jgi:hypothetical protein
VLATDQLHSELVAAGILRFAQNDNEAGVRPAPTNKARVGAIKVFGTIGQIQKAIRNYKAIRVLSRLAEIPFPEELDAIYT